MNSTITETREIHLASRPEGNALTAENFVLVNQP